MVIAEALYFGPIVRLPWPSQFARRGVAMQNVTLLSRWILVLLPRFATTLLLFALAAPSLGAQRTASMGAPSLTGHPLLPGDAIALKIWREPDLSGEFSVDESSVVVLPKVGPLNVRGITSDSLKTYLVSTYSSFLRNPSIEVRLLHRVRVLGAVQKPGLYPVDETMHFTDVLALAGGVAPDGNPNKITLVRDGQTVDTPLSKGLLVSDSPLRSGDQVIVGQKSWAARNPGILIGLGSTVVAIITTFAVRK
jgi:protein involved in polysaccharide export with SLBB domain